MNVGHGVIEDASEDAYFLRAGMWHFQTVFLATTQISTIFLRLIICISGDCSPIRETWLSSSKLLQRGF